MEKRRLLLPAILLIIAILIFIRLLRTTFLTQFLAVAVVFGPGMAISYGLSNPVFRPVAHLSFLLLFEVLSVLFLYSVLHLLPTEKRFENKLLDRVAVHMHKSRKDMVSTLDTLSGHFRRNFGDLGFYMALGLLSFAYGVFVAGAVAYFLKIRLKRAMVAISLGGAVAILFWWYMALGLIPFLTPTMIFVAVTGASLVFFAYGWVREKRIIERVSEQLLERGDTLTKKIFDNVDKLDPRRG